MDCKVPGIEDLKKVDGYLYLYEDEITRRYSSVSVNSLMLGGRTCFLMCNLRH